MDTIKKPRIIVALTVILVVASVGMWSLWESKRERLILATTTSTYDSGLLDALVPRFEAKYHAKVDVIAVGTGQAIATAEAGDADVVLVHSKSAELTFVAGGYGYHRVGVMYNDYVILGPSSDPAGIRGMANVAKAFLAIRDAGVQGACLFCSRGDNSGTHSEEKSIWSEAGVTPSGNWYLETGQGMGATLTVADQKQAYTIADRGTWVSYESKVNLAVLVEGDLKLLNPYAVIPVNPEKHPNTHSKMAVNFVQFLLSVEGQQAIGDFKREEEILFKPIARDIDLAKTLGFPDQQQELSWYDFQ